MDDIRTAKSERTFNFFQGALILALITGLFYSSGATEYHVFIEEFSLDVSKMARGSELHIYSGFFNETARLGSTLIVTIFLIFTYFVIDCFVPNSFKNIKNINLRKLAERSRNLFLFGLTLIFIIFIVIHANTKQIPIAQEKSKLVKQFHSKKLSKENKRLINIKINGVERKLTFIACGSSNCAGIDPVANNTHYFPSTEPYFFVSEFNNQLEQLPAIKP